MSIQSCTPPASDPLAFARTVRRALSMLSDDDRCALLATLGEALREATGKEERPALRRALLMLVGGAERGAG